MALSLSGSGSETHDGPDRMGPADISVWQRFLGPPRHTWFLQVLLLLYLPQYKHAAIIHWVFACLETSVCLFWGPEFLLIEIHEACSHSSPGSCVTLPADVPWVWPLGGVLLAQFVGRNSNDFFIVVLLFILMKMCMDCCGWKYKGVKLWQIYSQTNLTGENVIRCHVVIN